jgi:RNA polymerase sigma-70 factor, ECF subfamily
VNSRTSSAEQQCDGARLQRPDFENLSLEHLDSVYRMAMQLSRNPDEASDLVQETYLKALRAADRYQEQGGGMRPWLFKILHNVFFTRLERARRTKGKAEEALAAESAEPGPDEPLPAWNLADFDWEHVDERLKTAISRLKPEYREVLLLWSVEGLKYREIADVLGVPIGTVMSRLHRARTILTEDLATLAEEKRLAGS